ncbi:hypothetical protein TeGR_g5338, partial [Tetraparma gracilis]
PPPPYPPQFTVPAAAVATDAAFIVIAAMFAFFGFECKTHSLFFLACCSYDVQVQEGLASIRLVMASLSRGAADRQLPTFMFNPACKRKGLTPEAVKARLQIIEHLVSVGSLLSSFQIEWMMDPSAVLFLTGFPVNILDQGFVSSLFNPQGTSLAASMAPLCAAMLNMRLWGLKAVNLDILPTPHKWNQCTEKDPWSADDYKVMGEMA